MAATQVTLDATTLHYWSGLGDGRLTKEDLELLFLTDDRFADTREIIGCGDFKQLPPVPKFRYGDPGYPCLRSNFFNEVFPHHCDLVEVVRQNEPDLIQAIHQLCDGCPSDETKNLLKNLNRDIENTDGMVRLFGTNFDAAYINQYYLDIHDGEFVNYRANDEGNRRLLVNIGADQILSLKVGVPVILTRNLSCNLYNGLTGVVHSLHKDSGPTINFGGRLVPMQRTKFEEYDPKTHTVLASRVQYPLKLAFAFTVHRAQGQTFNKLEVDCFSFFSAGQMGVAIGRAVNKAGLKVLNYNSDAASLKHPPYVYDFYFRESQAPKGDITCCKREYCINAENDDSHPTSGCDSDYKMSTDKDSPNIETTVPEHAPSVTCPWSIDEFVTSEQKKTFMPTDITDSFKLALAGHANTLYASVVNLFKKKPKTQEDFSKLYKAANVYVTSDSHVSLCSALSASEKPQKLSTKLYFWLIDKKINDLAQKVMEPQKQKLESLSETQEISDAAKSKIRYIAGACIHKITARLRNNILKTVGKSDHKIRAQRDWDFRCHRLLKSLRVSEEQIKSATSEPESMFEIDFKQGKSRGLMHVSDDVFCFFKHLNGVLQKLLSNEAFHLHCDTIHPFTRNKLLSSEKMLDMWIDLFPNDDDSHSGEEDEMFILMLMDLYEFVVEHFLRVSLVEGLYQFKSKLPRKKKQALRTKITALTEREPAPNKKGKCDAKDEEGVYYCPYCREVLLDNPEDKEEESIACDVCNRWFHFKCEGLTGLESFLNESASTWKCSECCEKGKGKGGGKGRGRGRGKGRGRGRGKGRGRGRGKE